MKANALNNDSIKEEIHKWYAKDKTMSIQKRFVGVAARLIIRIFRTVTVMKGIDLFQCSFFMYQTLELLLSFVASHTCTF
jgi:hypothetical protein